MESDTTVERAREAFAEYYNAKASLKDELMQKLAAIGLGFNNIAVYGCFCEDDQEITFALQELHMSIQAHDNYQEWKNKCSKRLCAMNYLTILSNNSIAFDRLFKCDIFFKRTVEIWKSMWKDDYHFVLDEIDNIEEKYKMWTDVINKLKQLS